MKHRIAIKVAVYVLVATLKKRLGLSANLYTIMQALSLSLFENPLKSLLSETGNLDDEPQNDKMSFSNIFLPY